jgi:hypothetical protein
MSNRHTTVRGSAPAKRRTRWYVVILYGVLISLGLGILIFGRGAGVRNTDSAPSVSATSQQAKQDAGEKQVEAASRGKNAAPAADANLIEDDGKTLWASPTDGPPIDVAYLPPGTQFIIALRQIKPLEKQISVVHALGPIGRDLISELAKNVLGTRPDMYTLPRMVLGLQSGESNNWLMSRVAYYGEPFSDKELKEIAERYSDAGQGEHGGRSFGLVDDDAIYLPAPKHKERIVIAPKALIAEIIDLEGNPPPLRRDIERLLARTDSDRNVTVIVAPNSLIAEGRSIFAGESAGLREPLYWFLGDEFSAVALSLHWDENFFIELVAIPNLDTSPEKAARVLSDRLREVPDKVESYLATIKLHPHSAAVLARFPAMLRTMVQYTRSGFDRDCAELRCYLPIEAGHNLLMAAELTLAEGAGLVADFDKLSPGKATSPPIEAEAATSIRERLKKVASLRFARDTLEAALEQLSKDVGVEIVIRGPDLQADGITKNQQFDIAIENKTAKDILVEILRLANPDKTATSPSDERQKLVYVIERGADGKEQIVVTTRAAAAGRGDELPAVFRMEKP